MSYQHISAVERGKIEELHKLGYSSRVIGQGIGRHHSSIARELRRLGSAHAYTAQACQRDYVVKRARSRARGKWSAQLCAIITEKLKATWSPEQIAHTLTAGVVSYKTLYTWLYAGKFHGITAYNLRRKGKRRTSRNLAFFSRGVPIRKRPKEVNGRKTFGHWELDTIVSARGESGECLATFIERKTRFYLAVKMQDRTANSMESAIKQLYQSLPSQAFLSATNDRGGEFACFKSIKRDLGITMFFADPYSPHQRGSNEYANGLLREFFPKGTDFKTVDKELLDNALALINNRPRKCLNWSSPAQTFRLHLSHFT